MIKLDKVQYRIAQRTLGPISAQISQAEAIAILGPSGAGKSTLLKLISGELPVSLGRIYINAKTISSWSLSELSQVRAVLPQSYEISFDLSVNLVVSLGRLFENDAQSIQSIVDKSLVLAQAIHLKNRSYQTLSGGEKARVQLARVFCQLWHSRSGLLIMDEPVASLDLGLQRDILKSAKEFCAQRDHAMLVVLHDMNQAIEYFDQIWTINREGHFKPLSTGFKKLNELESLYQIPLKFIADFSGDRYIVPRSSFK